MQNNVLICIKKRILKTCLFWEWIQLSYIINYLKDSLLKSNLQLKETIKIYAISLFKRFAHLPFIKICNYIDNVFHKFTIYLDGLIEDLHLENKEHLKVGIICLWIDKLIYQLVYIKYLEMLLQDIFLIFLHTIIGIQAI